jgi:hypothetical protein
MEAVSSPSAQATRRPAGSGAPKARRRRGAEPLEQLSLELVPPRPRWTFSRRIRNSAHRRRVLERLEFVRRFFPELDACSIHVGQALKRGVLGWGSLDPERPGIWVRPIRLAYFTIAHEFVHLLQARDLVPRGERACDLWAMARSPLVIDCMPGYLRLPRALRARNAPDPAIASLLHRLACEAIVRRERGDRRYLWRFEREVAGAAVAAPGPRARRSAAAATRLTLALES